MAYDRVQCSVNFQIEIIYAHKLSQIHVGLQFRGAVQISQTMMATCPQSVFSWERRQPAVYQPGRALLSNESELQV